MKESTNKKTLVRIDKLLQKKKELLSLPPEKAMALILEAKEPAALVHSIQEQDLYFLINDIGPEDALPLLALASRRQWEYFLDIEIWHRDRIDLVSISHWLNLLYRANPRQTIQWLVEEKNNLIELFLSKNIDVKMREHDQDHVDFGPDYTTLDNVFYVRIIGPLITPESEFGDVEKKNFREFLSKLMGSLADTDYIAYQKILLETMSALPAEHEEELYRLRNVRLAEKGFLPWEEAVQVYQPLDPQQVPDRTNMSVSNQSIEMRSSVPHYPRGLITETTPFASGLMRIDNDFVLQKLQTELAGLCNRIASADFTRMNSKEALKSIVEKVSGYLSIGLNVMAEASGSGGQSADNRYAALVQRHMLSDIFRVGYSQALKLKWRAQDWLDQSWFVQQGLSLTFWDEQWLGVLGGLLVKKPMYFDNYQTGRIYREFSSIEDLKQSESVLSSIISMDNLLSLMEIQLGPFITKRFLTYKNLLLTLWVLGQIGTGIDVRILRIEEFRDFFVELWQHEGEYPCIKKEIKASFLNWLCDRSGLRDIEITNKLGQSLENLFSEIEDQYGRVDPAQLDPRYIHLFLLER